MLLLLAGLAGANSAAAQTSAKAAYKDPAQYGRPFAGVPDGRDATIYQVNMRGFSQAGNFAAVTARLDSIKALGVNVVYLMPIFPIGKLRAVDSPFAVRDYTAVNPEFGTLADLRTLVDAAHARGLAVMLDWVGNHTSFDHAWITEHPDWYVHDAAGNIVNPILDWKDIAQLNWAKPEVHAAMLQALRYWVFAANIDGYRFDYADGPTQEFFTAAMANLRAIPKHKLLLLAEGDKKKYYLQGGFDLCYDFGFMNVLKGDIFAKGKSVRLIDSVNTANYRNAPANARMLRYTSNHDINAWDGTPTQLFGNQRGAMAAFVVAAYMKAVPMVYNGQEVGYAERVPFMGARRPIDWTPNPPLTREYQRLLKFRNGSPAVRNGALASYSTDDICAFTKTAGREQVLVLANLRNATVNYLVPNAVGSTGWHNAFDGQPAKLEHLTLQPYQYLVLKK
ncbi:alpha-amylase family glycosyl hydrolase [Hymenobacter sp. DH14]|uniref:Alpha-amylase family glycosyl hydrolase n=1 Tax=Hymenobacter cyanobacteriorum TaxID=2926463 RepID=A0A9X1VJW7_9BACT|nr:alpha-amylase family glycosyl hydrolase [Hymenobacter cyanobacteriorum]MCI1190003.1 alpha-amylase family glycosyl hydrolase [Hymenobacter cyanobacteriorum]